MDVDESRGACGLACHGSLVPLENLNHPPHKDAAGPTHKVLLVCDRKDSVWFVAKNHDAVHNHLKTHSSQKCKKSFSTELAQASLRGSLDPITRINPFTMKKKKVFTILT